MKVTDVRIKDLRDIANPRLKAVASVTFDTEFVVHDIKILEGEEGMFIAMPSRKTPNGDFRDIAHPINQKTRDKIQKAVLEAYESEINQ